jgi:hypothetical protein
LGYAASYHNSALHSNAAGTLVRCRQPTIQPVLTIFQIRPGVMREKKVAGPPLAAILSRLFSSTSQMDE